MSTPVCPAAAERTRAFVAKQFGEAAATVVDEARAATGARERRIRTLRGEMRLREAERYGWVSLAGILLGLPLADISAMAVGDEMLVSRVGSTDPLPVPLFTDPDPVEVEIAGIGIEATDPTDPAGFEIFKLAGQIASGKAAVTVDGRALAASAVAGALGARLSKAAEHG